MNQKTQILKRLIHEEVRRQLSEAFPRNYEPGDRLANSAGQEIVVTQQRGYRINAKDAKTGETMQLEPGDLKDFKLVASKNKPITVKSGAFSMQTKTGGIMRNGKRVYDAIYNDSSNSYEVRLPLTDPSGKALPKRPLFFDSAQEVIDWFRKTDSKYDWATAWDRSEKDNRSIYDYD